MPPPEMPLPEMPYLPGTPEFASWAAEDKGPSSVAICWTFTALAIIFTTARCYTRLSMFHSLKSDDFWILLGLLCVILSSIFNTISVDYGNGQHYQLLSIHQATEVRRYTIAAFVPGTLSFVVTKFAVVQLLTRLLNPSRAHRIFLWSMCVLLLVSIIIAYGILFGQCDPVEALWDVTLIPVMECLDPRIYVNWSIWVGSLSAFIDLYLAFYPGFVLWKLQLKTQKKIALTVALSLGCVGGALAIYKTYRLPGGLENPDFSYETADLINWTIVEACAIIIAATIPVLSPLMDKLLRQYNPFASSRRSSHKHSSKGRKYYHGHGGSDNSDHRAMDERAPRHAPRDPYDVDMDLAETVVDNSDEDLAKFKKSDDLEAQRTIGHTRQSSSSSGSTQIGDNEHDHGMRQAAASPTSGIMRTNEVTVSIDPGRDQHMARLDQEIPWETPVQSPIIPPAQARAWGYQRGTR